MSIQQPAQHQQQARTVYVAVPKAADTVTVRVASGTVQINDTLHAVVRQTGGEAYVIGNLVLSATLIVVTIILQARSNKLQRDLKEMEERHERERRAADTKRDEAQRRATDARISGIAFAVRRQLISWIDEVPQGMDALVTIAGEFSKFDKKHGGSGSGTKFSMPSLAANILNAAIQWARERQVHFDRAEERMLQLVAAAPDGTEPVAESVRRVYVLFFQATSRLNQQVAKHQEGAVVEPLELATAFHEIEQCVIELGVAVGPELLKTEVLMARVNGQESEG